MSLHITLDASLTAWIEIRSKHDRLGTNLAGYILEPPRAKGLCRVSEAIGFQKTLILRTQDTAAAIRCGIVRDAA